MGFSRRFKVNIFLLIGLPVQSGRKTRDTSSTGRHRRRGRRRCWLRECTLLRVISVTEKKTKQDRKYIENIAAC